jgi:E2 ubiquitin ligase family protein
MSIAALAKCCPTWADFRARDGREAHVDVVALRASKTFTRLFELSVVQLADQIVVFERPAGGPLPACCPERHINPDGSFCIGLRAGEGVANDTAPSWWAKLYAFVLCQETAQETGYWPSEAQLSHGEAGEAELAAEIAACELGLAAAYREAVAFDSGRIADSLNKINLATGLLRNGRNACVCGRTDRRGRILLRRDCHRRAHGCPIMLEHRRRIKVREFWRGLDGVVTCCGTMRDCPLRRTSDSVRKQT